MSDEPASSKPSQIPSWVMLGFVIGALFVWCLQHSGAGPAVATHVPEMDSGKAAEPTAPAPPPAAAKPEAPAAISPAQQPLSTIDNVFAEWGRYAVWDNDLTEVALWDTQAKDYSDCFEVLKAGDHFYFRPIPHLTRPVLKHGGPPDPGCPLLFTETEEQQRQWLGARNEEAFRALTNSLHGNANPAPPKP